MKKPNSYEDCKTKEDFDAWYGRKPGWEKCQHEWSEYSGTGYERNKQCKKCGLLSQ